MSDLPASLNELSLSEICGLFDKAKKEKLDATNALEKSSKDVEALRKELVRRLAIPEGAPVQAKPVTVAPSAPAAKPVRSAAAPGERRSRAEKAAAVSAVKNRILTALGRGEWLGKDAILQGTDDTDWIAAVNELKEAGAIVTRGDRRSTEYHGK